MTGRNVRYHEIPAALTHGLTEKRISVDIADRVPVAIDEQHRLPQTAAVRRGAHVGDIAFVIQVPGITGAESRGVEGFGENGEIRGRPE